MPIEISILSGTRQGERLEFDTTTLRVGDKPSCDVYFNADHDHAVKGRHLKLQRTDDGWQLKNEGREAVWINHEPISSNGAIRSGDIVRLSELGPDFSFTILSGPRQTLSADSDTASPTEKATASPTGGQAEPVAAKSKPGSQIASTVTLDAKKPGKRDVHEGAATSAEEAGIESSSNTLPAAGARWAAIAAVVALVLVLAAIVWLLQSPEVRPPRLPEFAERTIREGEVFNLSAGVIDPGAPVGSLRYSLLAGDEYGIRIDPATGDLQWTTSEEHGPGQYEVTVQVLAASEEHEAHDEKAFVVNVLEVNQAPSFEEIPKQTVHLYQDISLNIQLQVNDPDKPSNRLNLALDASAPKGVQLDAQTGRLLWRPTPDQAGIHTLTIRVEDNGPEPLADETSFDVEVIKPDPWAVVEEQARRWTVMLVGEAPDTGEMFPFGVGTVVDRQAVVTNGVLVTELAKRARSGWKVHVFQPADQTQVAATRLLVHKAFELAKDQPAEQIYFDFGIVEVSKPFKEFGKLAPRAALASLERGQPVACVVIPHAGQPLTRFSRPEAKLARCEIYLMTQITSDENDPSSPRLLHLTGKLPRNIYGSPIVNIDGQVIGIYADRAAKPADADAVAVDDLHYATTTSLVEAWRKGQGTEYWKTPTVEESPKESDTEENKNRAAQ